MTAWHDFHSLKCASCLDAHLKILQCFCISYHVTNGDVALLHFAVNVKFVISNTCLAGSWWCFRWIYIWMLGKINVCLVGYLSTEEFHKINWIVSEAVVGKATENTRAACRISILFELVLSYWKLSSIKCWHWMLNLMLFTYTLVWLKTRHWSF